MGSSNGGGRGGGGGGRGGGGGGGGRGGGDDRSDAQRQADTDNRSNQLNPNNDAYHDSRGADAPDDDDD